MPLAISLIDLPNLDFASSHGYFSSHSTHVHELPHLLWWMNFLDVDFFASIPSTYRDPPAAEIAI